MEHTEEPNSVWAGFRVLGLSEALGVENTISRYLQAQQVTPPWEPDASHVATMPRPAESISP